MSDKTLKGRKMDAYVLLKILKYCTDSPARSYQMKYAVDQVFVNKSIDSTEELGTALKDKHIKQLPTFICDPAIAASAQIEKVSCNLLTAPICVAAFCPSNL